jgi:hypothetical protein
MRCYQPISSIVEFWELGAHLNYPLQLSAYGRESFCPQNEADAIEILALWFQQGVKYISVADQEEDDPVEGEDED